MTARFESPYFSAGTCCRWLRGNHHGHSTVSDGNAEPMEEVAAYETAGYDYLALSEHDTFLDPDQLQPLTAMCILPAVEVTSCYGQTLMFLGADRALQRVVGPGQSPRRIAQGNGDDSRQCRHARDRAKTKQHNIGKPSNWLRNR